MGRKGYPAEFRRRALKLLEAGGKVGDLAEDLGVSEQTIYTWRKQARIDAGKQAGLTTFEKEELASARLRIAELEMELLVEFLVAELHRRDFPESYFLHQAVLERRIRTFNAPLAAGVFGRRRRGC